MGVKAKKAPASKNKPRNINRKPLLLEERFPSDIFQIFTIEDAGFVDETERGQEDEAVACKALGILNPRLTDWAWHTARYDALAPEVKALVALTPSECERYAALGAGSRSALLAHALDMAELHGVTVTLQPVA